MFHLRFYNPLRSLNEARLVALLEEGERGSYASLQWLYRYVEKRNPAARAVKRRLLSALGALDWDIRVVESDDSAQTAMGERQAATLRAAYDRVDNLRAALEHLALGELRGFAHCEKIWDHGDDGTPVIVELRPVEQWFWCRDGLYGNWEYNPGARQGAWRGKAIDPRNFIIREVDDPADEIIAIAHVRQEISDSDWDGYLGRFGIPAVIIEGPPNVPAEKEAEYQRAAERVASDSSGYIPSGAKVHTVAPGTGSSVFADRLRFLDERIVIAGTSGKLTILTESGSGTLAGGAQQDAFMEVAQAIAGKVSEAMQAHFDAAELERRHPNEPVLAYFEFSRVEVDDTAAHVANAAALSAAGYEIETEELAEKTGYKLTRKAIESGERRPETGKEEAAGAPEVGSQKPEVGEAEKPQVDAAASVEKALRVTPGFIAPAKSVLDELLANAADGDVSDAEFVAYAEQIIASIPELAARTDVAGVADALEQAMRTAMETTLQG